MTPVKWIASVTLLLSIVSIVFLYSRVALSATATKPPGGTSHGQAYDQSFGFFTDITDVGWTRLKQRHRSTPNCGPLDCAPEKPGNWYQNNFEPSFTCLHERRVGGLGDGPKWVCDPHRINKKECLVYSIGSKNQFDFEKGVIKDIASNCEIHIFDPTVPNDDPTHKPPHDNVHFHPWGIANSNYQSEDRHAYKTMSTIVHELGHEHRRIDLFKIDCEGCEFSTVQGWFDAKVDIRQILVEIHFGTDFREQLYWEAERKQRLREGKTPEILDDRGQAKHFLETLQQQQYVVFHKEANTMGGGGYIEYALIKLGKRFFDE